MFWLRAFSFMFYMIPALIVSSFPLYFTELGFTHAEIGFLFSIGPLTGIAAGSIWGFFSDRLQRVKVLLQILMIGQLICMIGMFQTNSIHFITIWLIGFYFFQSAMIPLSDTMTLFLLGRNRSSYGSIRIMGSFGFALAAVVVGIWVQVFGLNVLQWISYGIIGLSLLCLFPLPEQHDHVQRPSWELVGETVSNRKLWYFLGLVFILAVAHRSNDAFLALYVTELGGSSSWIGWSWAAAAVSEVPFLLWTSRASNRVGPLAILTICAIMYAIRFVLMSHATTADEIFWIQWMHSVTFGLFLVTAIQAMMRWIPDSLRASGQALLLTVWINISGVFTGNVGGWLEHLIGFHGIYAIASLFSLISAIGFGWMHWTGRIRGVKR